MRTYKLAEAPIKRLKEEGEHWRIQSNRGNEVQSISYYPEDVTFRNGYAYTSASHTVEELQERLKTHPEQRVHVLYTTGKTCGDGIVNLKGLKIRTWEEAE